MKKIIKSFTLDAENVKHLRDFASKHNVSMSFILDTLIEQNILREVDKGDRVQING